MVEKQKSKAHNISFPVFIWQFKRLFILLHHQNPPSLFTMLKCAGRSIYKGVKTKRVQCNTSNHPQHPTNSKISWQIIMLSR